MHIRWLEGRAPEAHSSWSAAPGLWGYQVWTRPLLLWCGEMRHQRSCPSAGIHPPPPPLLFLFLPLLLFFLYFHPGKLGRRYSWGVLLVCPDVDKERGHGKGGCWEGFHIPAGGGGGTTWNCNKVCLFDCLSVCLSISSHCLSNSDSSIVMHTVTA